VRFPHCFPVTPYSRTHVYFLPFLWTFNAFAEKLKDLNKAQTLDLFQLLVLTYPRYIDSASRDAVVEVLEALIRHDAAREKDQNDGAEPAKGFDVLLSALKWLAGEASRVCKKGVAG
jgi:hypothetical protein